LLTRKIFRAREDIIKHLTKELIGLKETIGSTAILDVSSYATFAPSRTGQTIASGNHRILTMPKLTRISVFGIRLATIVLAVYWIALFTGTHMPSPPRLGVRVNDKIQHFTAFFGLATLLYWVVPARRNVMRKIAIVLVVAITYAAFDEWSQRFSPRRTVDIQDFFTNVGGIMTATLVYVISRAIWLRFLRPRPSVTRPPR
jgi:VanZ family protein